MCLNLSTLWEILLVAINFIIPMMASAYASIQENVVSGFPVLWVHCNDAYHP